MSDTRRGELEAKASKSPVIAFILGFLGPLGYLYVDEWGLALINLLTFNYLLLGFVVVPIHAPYITLSAGWKLGKDDANQ